VSPEKCIKQTGKHCPQGRVGNRRGKPTFRRVKNGCPSPREGGGGFIGKLWWNGKPGQGPWGPRKKKLKTNGGVLGGSAPIRVDKTGQDNVGGGGGKIA